MKTKFRIKQLWKYLFSISLIAFHIHLVFCRPSVSRNDDTDNALQDLFVVDYSSNSKGRRQTQVRPQQPPPPARPVYDLRNVGPTEIYTMRGDRKIKNNDTLILYSSSYKDFVDFDVIDDRFENDVIDDDTLPTRGDDDDGTPTRDDDVIVHSDKDKEVAVVDSRHHHRLRHQVVPFREEDRNLVRKRRQPEPHRPHRRRRRKHRLVLKARDRNHLSDGEEDLKEHRRGRFLIKSDSPGYVITSASEVKKDWCRTIPLRQKVSEPHCRSRVVQNNFCYGQCNSFFIPHTGRTDNKVAFQSCAFCKPFKQHWGNVTLNCPGRNPPKVEKTVLFVETCRCITEVFQ